MTLLILLVQSAVAAGLCILLPLALLDRGNLRAERPWALEDPVHPPPMSELMTHTAAFKQLTSWKVANSLSCTPDGHWVVYQDLSDMTVYRISIDGDQSARIPSGS